MDKKIVLILNGKEVHTALPAGTLVVDFLRRDRQLTGTKEGCREGDCGACAVLLGEWVEGRVRYRPLVSCLLPLGETAGKHLLTIEGLNGDALFPTQRAIVEEGGVQCGFCTPGMVVSLSGFMLNSATFAEEEAWASLDGNICRCTGYLGIRRAASRLCRELSDKIDPGAERVAALAEGGFLPSYMRDIPARLQAIQPPSTGETAPGVAADEILVAGGTDLFVQRPEELKDAPLHFIFRQKPLSSIWLEDGNLFIGAAATVEEVKRSPVVRDAFPPLLPFLDMMASTPIRQRATVGGNIVNASPIGDMSIILLALGSRLRLSGGAGERDVPLANFFRAYKSLELEKGEILRWVSFSAPPAGFLFNFEKVGRRQSLDIASVNSAAAARLQNGHIAAITISAGGVAPVPLLLRRTGEFLSGRTIERGRLEEAVRIADEEISPISDVRGSADYKRLLLRQLLWAHFLRFFPGSEPPEVRP